MCIRDSIITTEGVGAYGETPEEYLCRMETLHELMAVLDTCTEAQRQMCIRDRARTQKDDQRIRAGVPEIQKGT